MASRLQTTGRQDAHRNSQRLCQVSISVKA
jgi:hypothetical protein